MDVTGLTPEFDGANWGAGTWATVWPDVAFSGFTVKIGGGPALAAMSAGCAQFYSAFGGDAVQFPVIVLDDGSDIAAFTAMAVFLPLGFYQPTSSTIYPYAYSLSDPIGYQGGEVDYDSGPAFALTYFSSFATVGACVVVVSRVIRRKVAR